MIPSITSSFSDEIQLLCPIKVVECINREVSLKKIVKMAQLHDKLTDIVGSVNRRYSVQVKLIINTVMTKLIHLIHYRL